MKVTPKKMVYKVGDFVLYKDSKGLVKEVIDNSLYKIVKGDDEEEFYVKADQIVGKLTPGEEVIYRSEDQKEFKCKLKKIKSNLQYEVEFSEDEKLVLHPEQLHLLVKGHSFFEHNKNSPSKSEIKKDSETQTKSNLQVHDAVHGSVIKELSEDISSSFLLENRNIEDISPREIVFLLHLEKFKQEEDDEIHVKPKLHDMQINLFNFAEIVQSNGGFEKVKMNKKWKTVSREIGVKNCHVSTFKSLKFTYSRYIEPFIKHIHELPDLPCCEIFSKGASGQIMTQLKEEFKLSVESFDEMEEDKSEISGKKIQEALKKSVASDSSDNQNSDDATFKPNRASSTTNEPSSEVVDQNIYDTIAKLYQTSKYPILSSGDRVRIAHGPSKDRKYYEATIINTKQMPTHIRYFVHYADTDDSENQWVHEKRVSLSQECSGSNTPSQSRPRSSKYDNVISPQQNLTSSQRRSRLTMNSMQDELLEAVLKASALEYSRSSGKTDETVSQSNSDPKDGDSPDFKDKLPVTTRKRRKKFASKSKAEKINSSSQNNSSEYNQGSQASGNNKNEPASQIIEEIIDKTPVEIDDEEEKEDKLATLVADKLQKSKDFFKKLQEMMNDDTVPNRQQIIRKSLKQFVRLRNILKNSIAYYSKKGKKTKKS